MKIKVTSSGGHEIHIPFPSILLTSPALIRFGLSIGQRYTDAPIPEIPPEAAEALCAAIRNMERKYEHWELLRVQEADGALISIEL